MPRAAAKAARTDPGLSQRHHLKAQLRKASRYRGAKDMVPLCSSAWAPPIAPRSADRFFFRRMESLPSQWTPASGCTMRSRLGRRGPVHSAYRIRRKCRTGRADAQRQPTPPGPDLQQRGSTCWRMAEYRLPVLAGPEYGNATKTYTNTAAASILLASEILDLPWQKMPTVSSKSTLARSTASSPGAATWKHSAVGQPTSRSSAEGQATAPRSWERCASAR